VRFGSRDVATGRITLLEPSDGRRRQRLAWSIPPWITVAVRTSGGHLRYRLLSVRGCW